MSNRVVGTKSFKSHVKNAPGSEFELGEKERVTEEDVKDKRVHTQCHSAPAALCQLIESELSGQQTSPGRHTSFSLIITSSLLPLSVLSVLCICCLRVLLRNKPQIGIHPPPSTAFHFHFFSPF